MRDRELYARLLGITAPWQVQDVELRLDDGEVLLRLTPAGAVLRCPHCRAAAPGYGACFTALFEALVIDWLHEASLAAVARRLQMSWDEVDGIQQRAVVRGLARRPAAPHRIDSC